MNTFAIKFVAVTISAFAALPAFAQQSGNSGNSGNAGGSGSGAGGTNIDNVSFSVVGNLPPVLSGFSGVVSPVGGGGASVTLVSATGGEPVTLTIPPSMVQTILAIIEAVSQSGGAGAGPLSLRLRSLIRGR